VKRFDVTGNLKNFAKFLGTKQGNFLSGGQISIGRPFTFQSHDKVARSLKGVLTFESLGLV
jgi:hypothetical protein